MEFDIFSGCRQKMNLSDNVIKKKLTIFINDKFLKGNTSKILNDNESFLDRGIIDSTGVLELISFIEEKYNIKVDDEELIPDNLDSINKLVAYIKKKTSYVN
jgi:acyl carrier protein